MFYEYAVDPQIISSWEIARYFLDAFGSWEGRFLADFPADWRAHVREHIKTVSTCREVERLRIIERINRIDRKTLASRLGAKYVKEKSFLDNAEIEHVRVPRREFRAIISLVASGKEHILTGDSLDKTNLRWATVPGVLVDRDSVSIISALHTLLSLSKHVVIIDPHFRAHRKEKSKVLEAICDALPTENVKVDVHSRLGEDRDPDYRWLKSEVEGKLPRKIPRGVNVKFFFWKEREKGPRLHNRYLITDIGGIKFGDSIEHDKEGKQDHLSILDEKTRSSLWQHYVTPGDGFEPIEMPIEIVGVKKL